MKTSPAMKRAKEFCALHGCELDDVIEKSLTFWLETLGETYTEELLNAAGSQEN